MRRFPIAFALAACTPDPAARVAMATHPADFWPEIGQPVASSRQQLLAYQPTHATGVGVDIATTYAPAGTVAIASRVHTTLRLAPGESMGWRVASVTDVSGEITKNAQRTSFVISPTGATIDTGHGPQPAEAGSLDADYETLLGEPLYSVELTANQAIVKDARAIAKTFNLEAFDLGFVELPVGAVASGATWKAVRQVEYGRSTVEVTVEHHYVGDGPCLSAPAKTCAHIDLAGHVDNSEQQQRQTVRIQSAFRATVLFDIADGIPDAARTRTATDITVNGFTSRVDSTVTTRALR